MQRCPYIHEMRERLLGPQLPQVRVQPHQQEQQQQQQQYQESLAMESFERERDRERDNLLPESRPESNQVGTVVMVRQAIDQVNLLWIDTSPEPFYNHSFL